MLIRWKNCKRETMKKYETIIKNRLKKTIECGFKKAWIPTGWTCVHIDKFSKGLAKELKKGE